MARLFLTPLDLGKNELQNAVIQNLGSAPSSPVKGQIYMNSGDNTLYFYDGSGWVSTKTVLAYGAVTAERTYGIASNNGAATTVARSDHTHGTPDLGFGSTQALAGTTLLNQIAAPDGNLNLNNNRIANLLDPSSAQEAATKAYVDALVQGLAPKDSVRAATTANITLSAPQTIDGISITAGQRVLVKDQTTQSANGIYQCNAGAWTRVADMDIWAEFPGAFTFVEEGSTQADSGWVCTNDQSGTLGTTSVTWTQFSGAGQITAGTGMTKTGNTLNVIAGTGITANADDVAVNFAGTGSATTAAKSDHNHDTTYPPLARTISTTAPLSGGGDLSANRTLTVSQFTSGAAGVVPASGGGTTTFMRADGTWAAPAGGGTVNKVTQACAAATSTVVTTTAINSRDCTVAVYRSTTPWDEVECDVEHTSATSVTVRFATAPTAGQFNIVVTG